MYPRTARGGLLLGSRIRAASGIHKARQTADKLDMKIHSVLRGWVNFNNGSPTVVPQSGLQNKKNRYYFYDAFKLNRGELFVSPLDLNIENGGEVSNTWSYVGH